tara:strand:- start:280 stop:483 length:204 start_codon:yes stop_codon:yes gene_type:complete
MRETLQPQEQDIMTLTTIVKQINAGNTECLYLATQAQMDKLISSGRIDEDFAAKYDEAQEEMRCLMA